MSGWWGGGTAQKEPWCISTIWQHPEHAACSSPRLRQDKFPFRQGSVSAWSQGPLGNPEPDTGRHSLGTPGLSPLLSPWAISLLCFLFFRGGSAPPGPLGSKGPPTSRYQTRTCPWWAADGRRRTEGLRGPVLRAQHSVGGGGAVPTSKGAPGLAFQNFLLHPPGCRKNHPGRNPASGYKT